jgi:hypothetical protein
METPLEPIFSFASRPTTITPLSTTLPPPLPFTPFSSSFTSSPWAATLADVSFEKSGATEQIKKDTININGVKIPLIEDIQPGKSNYFNANISGVEKIFFISDVHGDMYGFIINLRDNAKVIRKKPGFEFNQDILDADLERQMNINLNELCKKDTMELDNILNPSIHEYSHKNQDNSLSQYNDDMNYEWIGGNAHIVIVGDIIDNFRGVSNDEGKILGEHIHEEVKLIRFINAIDDLAKVHGGRVIKLFGNHDFASIFSATSYIQNISPYALKQENHIHNIIRRDYFTSDEGMNLLRYNSMGIILKINNYLCVHGAFTGFHDLMFNGRVGNLQSINDVVLNLLYNKRESEYINTFKYREFLLGSKGLLFNRDYGDHHSISQKYKNGTISKYCSTKIIPGIQSVCDDDIVCKDTIKLVIGHCVQGNNITNSDNSNIYVNQGYKHNSYDEITQTQTLVPELRPQQSKENYHYGMSFSCTSENPESPDPRLLRVDVGISRGFDDLGWYLQRDRTEKELYDYFKSKLPQIIEVDCKVTPNNIQLKRTTIKNMFIHQPRTIFNDPIYTPIKEKILTYANTRNELAGGVKYKLNIN